MKRMSDALRYAPVAAAALAVALFLWRRSKESAVPPSVPAAFAGPATFDEARARLTGTGGGGDVGARSGVLAAGVEASGPGGTTLVLVLSDGTVSMFLRGGPGVAGLSRVPPVRDAADAFLAAVAAHASQRGAGAEAVAAPSGGGDVVHARTEGGTFSVALDGGDAGLVETAGALSAAVRAAVAGAPR